MQPQSGACRCNTRGRPRPTRFLLSWVAHFLSFSFADRLSWAGTLDILPRRDDNRWAADEDTNNIDKQGSDCQHAEQQRLWEIDPKEGIQRIASWPDQAQSDAHDQQHQ